MLTFHVPCCLRARATRSRLVQRIHLRRLPAALHVMHLVPAAPPTNAATAAATATARRAVAAHATASATHPSALARAARPMREQVPAMRLLVVAGLLLR